MVPLITNCVRVKVLSSTSVSFDRTFTVTGVSSLVVAASSTATGASLTGVTVIARSAVSVSPSASLIV